MPNGVWHVKDKERDHQMLQASQEKKLNLKLIKYLDQGFSSTGNSVLPEHLATSGYIFNAHNLGGQGATGI